jgi:hypothetical protein
VPYHITSPGTYVLGANLTLSSVTGGAIVIRTNHVTLDLAGHYLFNPNPPSSSPLSWGVYVENGANVTIQNGIIVNFFHGVFFTYSTALNSGNVVQNLRLTNPIIGIQLFKAAGSIVRNNQIRGPGSTTSTTGIEIDGGGGNLVSGNVVSDFGVCVFAEGGNYFFENMVSNAIIGFDLSNTDKYRFNTTFNCTAPFDGGTAVNAENN